MSNSRGKISQLINCRGLPATTFFKKQKIYALIAVTLFSFVVKAGEIDFSQEMAAIGELRKKPESVLLEVLEAKIQAVDGHLRDQNLSPEDRGRLLVIKSAHVGLKGERLRSVELGRQSFSQIKEAVRVSPQSLEVVKAYGLVILSFLQKNSVLRFFIERSLKISITDEKSQALVLISSLEKPSDDLLKLRDQLLERD